MKSCKSSVETGHRAELVGRVHVRERRVRDVHPERRTDRFPTVARVPVDQPRRVDRGAHVGVVLLVRALGLGFVVPIVYYGAYFVVTIATGGTWFDPPLLGGALVWSGVCGLGISFLPSTQAAQ